MIGGADGDLGGVRWTSVQRRCLEKSQHRSGGLSLCVVTSEQFYKRQRASWLGYRGFVAWNRIPWPSQGTSVGGIVPEVSSTSRVLEFRGKNIVAT